MWFNCFIVLAFSGAAHCLTCLSGNSVSKLSSPKGEVECATRCYVKYDKYSSWKKNTWAIGCMDSTELSKCGTSAKDTDKGSTNAYCCCNTDKCNTYNFGFYCYIQQDSSGLSAFSVTCNKGQKTGSQNPIAPTSTTKCTGQCYVELRDYATEAHDRWTYGCQGKGYLKNCGEKAVSKSSYKRTTCCCEGPTCNTFDFAKNCAPEATVNNPVVVVAKPSPKPVQPVNPVVTGFKCKAGSTTIGKLSAPNSNDVQCNGKCYVMRADYDNSGKSSWTYGCLKSSQTTLCGTPHDGGAFTNNYCCCDGERCNDRDFADEYCSSSVIYRISVLALLPIALYIFFLNN